MYLTLMLGISALSHTMFGHYAAGIRSMRDDAYFPRGLFGVWAIPRWHWQLQIKGNPLGSWKLPICSPWTFRENHSPNIIYTVSRRNQPTAMDLYFLDWVRTRYKTEPETHTKSSHTVLWPSGRQLWIGTTRSAGVGVWVSVSDMGRVGSGWPRGCCCFLLLFSSH